MIMKTMLNKHAQSKPKVIDCCRKSGELAVQNGLAVTPSQMMDMANRGIPVSMQNFMSTQFNDGIENPTFDVPGYRRRGVDIGELWEEQQTARRNIRDKSRKAFVEQSKQQQNE